MLGVAVHHGKIFVLTAGVKPDPQSEPVRQREFFVYRVRQIDGGRTLVFDDVARHQVTAVGCGIEDDIIRTPFDAAFKDRLEGLVGGIGRLEGEVVTKKE